MIPNMSLTEQTEQKPSMCLRKPLPKTQPGLQRPGIFDFVLRFLPVEKVEHEKALRQKELLTLCIWPWRKGDKGDPSKDRLRGQIENQLRVDLWKELFISEFWVWTGVGYLPQRPRERSVSYRKEEELGGYLETRVPERAGCPPESVLSLFWIW